MYSKCGFYNSGDGNLKTHIDKNRRRFVLVAKLVLLSGVSAFLAGCNQASSEPQHQVVKPVKLYEVPDIDAAGYDGFLAEVDAAERSQLSFQIPGEIETLQVREGQKVEKGQLLATLDPTDYQLAVEASQAQYDLVNTHHIRNEQLFSKKLISADVFDQSLTALKVAEANLEEAKTDLRYTQIRAPFDGLVSLSFVKPHQFVAAKTPILNIINNDKLDITVSVPVPYADAIGIEELKLRDYAVVFDTHNSVIIPAIFKEVSTQPEADTNSYTTTVTIQRPHNMNILTGMTGQVLIANNHKNSSLRLPEEAWVTKEGSKGQVWRFNQENNSVEAVTVELDKFGFVTRGLKAGDRVIIAGAKDLRAGQTVKAWTREDGI